MAAPLYTTESGRLWHAGQLLLGASAASSCRLRSDRYPLILRIRP